MALSVGVVTIEYLAEPQPPVSDFLKDLAADPSIGTEDDSNNYWGGGWGENTFLEFELSALIAGADVWSIVNDLGEDEWTSLETWLSNLPSRDGYVMLHLAV